MKWWNRLSIRTQLIIFMTILVSILEASTLFVINHFDKQEAEQIALDVVKTFTISSNNDLIKAPLSPSADTFADINNRISGYKNVNSMVILDENKKPIMHYGDVSSIIEYQEQLKNKDHLFTEYHLFAINPITADNHTFGYTLLDVDPTEYREKQLQDFYSLMLLFPITLFAGILVSWILSLNYTRPFSNLAKAMRKNDVAANQFYEVESPAKNEVGQLFDGYNQMIHKIEATTDQLRYQSEHDDLTGLYNRYYIEREINDALQDETIDSNALIMIDLDQFNIINNAAGFQAGDELLKMIANQCQQHLPEFAKLARIGGDDFYLLLRNVSEPEALELIKDRISALADFRFSWEGEAYSISACMGMVIFKPNQYTLEEVIKAAHSAFHTAKSKGRGKFEIYQESGDANTLYREDIQVANFIKEALGDGPARFELFAQDIVPLQQQTDKVSYEILIRMWDSNGEFVSPGSFLPTAERYQLMTEIDVHVLWNFLEMVTQHPEHIEKLHVAHVNLAGATLNNPDFQAKLKEAVSKFSFPWHKLELEVTETSAVGNFNQAKQFIEYCKSLGIGLALDDFGTGMSSFEYLKSLPFDVVKIDGSFVKDMHKDPSDKAVIRYIQEISAYRNQETVAEFVETQEDVDTLREIGITYEQGYFPGKPRPLSEWLGH